MYDFILNFYSFAGQVIFVIVFFFFLNKRTLRDFYISSYCLQYNQADATYYQSTESILKYLSASYLGRPLCAPAIRSSELYSYAMKFQFYLQTLMLAI